MLETKQAEELSVSQAESKYLFAVPDGKFIGDLFVITDSRRRILVVLLWDGHHWIEDKTT